MGMSEKMWLIIYKSFWNKCVLLPVLEVLHGKDENVRSLWPVEEVRPLILVAHDESTFPSHDGLKRLWFPTGEQPLRKKFTEYMSAPSLAMWEVT